MTSAVPITATSTPGGRHLSRLIGLLVAVCLAAAGLTAQPAQAADTGSITGQVFTQAVGGAKTPASGGYIYWSYAATPDGSYSGSTGHRFTGSTFSLTGLKSGFYKFEVAEATDTAGSSAYQREYYNDRENFHDATVVEVVDGKDTRVAEMVIEPAGQISGLVTDTDGNPIPNASVSFQTSATGGGPLVRTGPDGRYSTTAPALKGLVKGAYRVSARHDAAPGETSHEEEYWKDKTTYATATPVQVTPGATTPDINFTLAKAPRLQLTVKDPAGNPVPNADVGIWMFYEGEWGPYRAGPNTTDATGVYRKTVRIGERYKLFFKPPAGVGGVTEWYDNAYSEDTAREVTATSHGEVIDIEIKLGPAPAVAGLTPTITGTPEVGQQLTVDPGTWGPAGVELAYQWFANGALIQGATQATYTPSIDDATKAITVRVTGTLPNHTTAVKTSTATAPVATPPVVAPVVTGAAPVISGTPRSGKTLSVATGSWAPAGVSLARQWSANGVAIPGATGSTLRLTNAQAGKRITATVNGSISGSDPVVRTSAATTTVQGVLTAKKVSISGTAKVGRTLRARTGSWGPSPVTSSYKWYRNGRAISGQSKSTYKLRKADVGKRITVRVTQRKSSYVTISKLSSKTGKVKKK